MMRRIDRGYVTSPWQQTARYLFLVNFVC